MQKRVFLAFSLSFLVLILGQIMFPQPRMEEAKEAEKIGAEEAQHIENKEVIGKGWEQKRSSTTLPDSKKSPKKEAITSVISNDKLSVILTTDGGSIASANILKYDTALPVRGIFELAELPELEYRIESTDGQEVVYIAQNNGLEIRKRYRIMDDEHILTAGIQLKNISKNTMVVSPDIQTMLIDMTMAEEGIEKGRDRNLLEYSVYSEGKVVRKTGAYKFTEKDSKEKYAPVDWFGFRNRYYCTIFKPEFKVNGYGFSVKDEKALSSKAMLNDITLEPKEEASFSARIFFGPQKDDLLESSGKDFEKIHVYFRAKFFDSIAKIIEDFIKFVHKLTKNWGVSIIFVSLAIYFSFYPLTMKSMLSMRRMQSLQPQISELREKYEKNPQKLNQEIMKLYSENKVNPLGGCLPLLLQMPIFICLYQMIWRSVLFKGANFLWIKDLSQPDRLMMLDKSYPIIGNEINVLPLVILVLMFVQQKITSKNMKVTDPNQLAQQKMMTFMMPALLFFVFYHIASGLTLYFTVFYIVSSYTQWYIGKKEKAVG